MDEIIPQLVRGSLDIAAVPANVSSVLYNNTDGEIIALAVHTLGILYIVESGDTVNSVEDLRGKTVYSSGKGGVTEFALNYILAGNGLENDVTIEWKSEHTELAVLLAERENVVALLPQPFVTIARTANENIRVALDLTDEWDKIQEMSDTAGALIAGVLVARAEFVKENPEAVSEFLNRYEASVNFVNSNIPEAAVLIGNYDIVPALVAEKAIPYCKITFIEGMEMKELLSGFLSVLYEQSPDSIGGGLPDENFYFAR
jgi:NitT/TauT family transport system substrate-binding protein